MPYTPIQTQSCIPLEWKPELGDYLGDLTDEVPDNRIIEFVTVDRRTMPTRLPDPTRMEIRPYVK